MKKEEGRQLIFGEREVKNAAVTIVWWGKGTRCGGVSSALTTSLALALPRLEAPVRGGYINSRLAFTRIHTPTSALLKHTTEHVFSFNPKTL